MTYFWHESLHHNPRGLLDSLELGVVWRGMKSPGKPREGQEERRRLVGWQGTTARIFS